MSFVSTEELKKEFGGTSNADLCSRLAAAKIKFIPGKQGKPVTTWDAINEALGIRKTRTNASKENQPRKIEL